MKNSTEYLRGCKVPKVAENLSPEYLEHDKSLQRHKRDCWGSGDFKELIRTNMEGSKHEKRRE